MAIIELKNVWKTYHGEGYDVQAIRGINAEIHEGEFIVILGKSGSGKSTLLSLLGGLEQPTQGKIIWKGKELGTLSEDKLAILRRKEVGIIFQHFHLMEAMTALDNVELPLLIAGVPKRKRRGWCVKLLDLVGLEERYSHYPSELSGGERQRVGIARAFANKAAVIIADEPTGDLDSKRGKEIVKLLFSINKGKEQKEILEWNPTIVMVTHDVGMLIEGMRVLTLSDGQITNDEIFDGDYDRFDRLGNPSVVITEYKSTDSD